MADIWKLNIKQNYFINRNSKCIEIDFQIQTCIYKDMFRLTRIIGCTWRFQRNTNNFELLTRYRQHLQHSMKLNSTIRYTAVNLKLISVKCLTHVFNPSTYVLVFVARIQDASFPPTHVSTQEYNITNSMYKLLCSNIKNSYRKVGSTKLIRLLWKLFRIGYKYWYNYRTL